MPLNCAASATSFADIRCSRNVQFHGVHPGIGLRSHVHLWPPATITVLPSLGSAASPRPMPDPPPAMKMLFAMSFIEVSWMDGSVQAVKRRPNIGRPLFDSALVASSCKTSQCSARRPFSILTISAATQATGRPVPEKRPCTMT
jgi:hypothetical protein